jgi:hypothetical protein
MLNLVTIATENSILVNDPPFTQPDNGKSKLKKINPIANLAYERSCHCLVLLSNFMENIGTIETTPNILPPNESLSHVCPYVYFFSSYAFT